MREINRQAQAIGLNTGGTFAKTLSVYLGGGSGPTAASTLANGVVSVNLGQSTVDAQSLGLNGVQATNGAAYDLGSASTTSVAAILADTTDNTTTVAGQTQFSFAGPGFGGGVSISVNLNGVADAADLAANVNAAIQTAAQGTSGAAAAFKNANITASIVTNASGQQQLGFTSSTAAFQVSSGDKMASALMGSFDTTVGAAAFAGSAAGFSEIAGGSQELGTVTAGVNTEHDLTWGTAMAVTDSQVISISANDASGTAHPLSVTLADATNGVTEAQAITAINNKLQQSNDSTLQQITAVQGSSGGINFISTLPGFTVSVGSNTTSGDGITSSVGDSLQAMQVGTGSTADISTVARRHQRRVRGRGGRELLGSAQAAIGKGENQLNYAINLAELADHQLLRRRIADPRRRRGASRRPTSPRPRYCSKPPSLPWPRPIPLLRQSCRS